MENLPLVSASNYSNSAPLIWSFQRGSRQNQVRLITDAAPSKCAEMLRRREVDIALTPIIEYQTLDDVLLVPGVCVGAREKVRSVCLVTKDIDLKDAKSVALDVSSRTSVALTKIVFREFLGFEPFWKPHAPNLSEMLAAADCALLIGDPALQIDEKRYRKFDLAALWKSFTGLGFVFAMWMARRESMETARKIDFAGARDEGLEKVEEIISAYQKKTALSRGELYEYLTRNISYSIDESLQKGLSLYFELAYKNGLVGRREPIRFTHAA